MGNNNTHTFELQDVPEDITGQKIANLIEKSGVRVKVKEVSFLSPGIAKINKEQLKGRWAYENSSREFEETFLLSAEVAVIRIETNEDLTFKGTMKKICPRKDEKCLERNVRIKWSDIRIKLNVVEGNIAEFSKADVLVNPVSGTMTDLRQAGQVSRAFYELGRQELQKTFLKAGPPQRFGTDVTITKPPRSFSCKWILHPAIRGYRNQKSLQLYTSMIKECLKIAELQKMTSIAFPAAGCGQLRYHPPQVARCFLEAAKETELQIYIVVYPKELCETFKEILVNEEKSDNDITFPRYWKNPTALALAAATSKTFPLDKGSLEYKNVTAFVRNTWDPRLVRPILGRNAGRRVYSRIKITNIWTIENQELYDNYQSKVKLFASRAANNRFSTIAGLFGEPEILTNRITGVDCLRSQLRSELNEVYLFHGTSHVEEIVKSGIDSRFCGDNVLFGKGAYFAESSTKSDRYADPCRRTPRWPRLYMFIARVLLGAPFLCRQARPDLKKAPCSAKGCMKDNCTRSHPMCDSVVGTHRDPSTRLQFREFIVYSPDQSYPEFLVEYVRV